MTSIDPNKTEIAMGNCPIDVRTTWRSTKTKADTDLRLARQYWLQTIEPHITGRKLHGVEFFIAQEAHEWLRMMTELATPGGNDGKIRNASQVLSELENDGIQKPEELCADETLKPEILAAIAAPLAKTEREKMSTDEAIRTAHELLMAAQKYLITLPKKQGTGSLVEIVELGFRRVTFAEIERSNGEKLERLPLLPPVQKKRNKGKMKIAAIKAAVQNFLLEHNPTKRPYPLISQADYEQSEQEWQQRIKKSEEDKAAGIQTGTPLRMGNGKILTYQEWQEQNRQSIDEFLQNQQISYRLLGTLRWNRFKDHWHNQQLRTKKENQPNPKN